MNAKTLKVAAILCLILAAGLAFQTVWSTICLPAVKGPQRTQAWFFLAIGIVTPLLAGCLGWSFWRKANDPANADRESSPFKINNPLKIVGIIFIGIIGTMFWGLLMPALLGLLGFYFWQKRGAKKPPPIVPTPGNSVPQPVANMGNKLCQSGWLCVVLALVLPFLMLLVGQWLFPKNGEAVGMLAAGFGFIPAVMLFVAALVLAVMSLARREPHRWQSVLLLVVTLSPLGLVFYNFSPEPRHTITVYRANHGDLKAIQSLVGSYSLGGFLPADPRQQAYWTEKGARAGLAGMALEWGCLHDGLLDDPRLNAPGSRGGIAVDFLGRVNRQMREDMQIKADDNVAIEFYQRALRPEDNAVNAESQMNEIIQPAEQALAYMANRYVGLAQAAEKRFTVPTNAEDLKQAKAFYAMAIKADAHNQIAQAGLKRLAASHQASP